LSQSILPPPGQEFMQRCRKDTKHLAVVSCLPLWIVNLHFMPVASPSRRLRSRGGFFPSRRHPIGIGRDLAATPLPHHLAYGSRTKAVRLIMSASLPTGGSVSSVHHEHRSFEQLRFRQLYSHYTKDLLTTSTVRAFSHLVSGSAYLFLRLSALECLTSFTCQQT
jgi:hypothetical protein